VADPLDTTFGPPYCFDQEALVRILLRLLLLVFLIWTFAPMRLANF
jgi:hypothetical protein